MKKEEFMKLGLDEDLAKECELASSEELKGFIPKARFDEVNSELKTTKEQIKERDTQLETLKSSGSDAQALKNQIEALQSDNKANDEAHAAEMKKLKVDMAVAVAISAAKGKNAKAIKALLDLENADFNDDGTVKTLSDQLKKLQEDESSSFMFGEANTPPAGFKPREGSKEPDLGGQVASLGDAVKAYFNQ